MAPTRAEILAAATAALTDEKRAGYARRLGQYKRWCAREGVERPIPCSPASYRAFVGGVRLRESVLGAEQAGLSLGWLHGILALAPPWQGPVPQGCVTLGEANRAVHQCSYEDGLARVKAARERRAAAIQVV